MVNLKNNRFKRLRDMFFIILIWFALWQIAAMLVNQSLFLPDAHRNIWITLELADNKQLLAQRCAYFLPRCFWGLPSSFAAGIALAFFAAHIPALEKFLRPFMAAVKSTPVMSIIVLALVWFSSSFVPIFSCILLCLPNILYQHALRHQVCRCPSFGACGSIQNKTASYYHRNHNPLRDAACLLRHIRLPRFFMESCCGR